jgi:hypothetical protein
MSDCLVKALLMTGKYSVEIAGKICVRAIDRFRFELFLEKVKLTFRL